MFEWKAQQKRLMWTAIFHGRCEQFYGQQIWIWFYSIFTQPGKSHPSTLVSWFSFSQRAQTAPNNRICLNSPEQALHNSPWIPRQSSELVNLQWLGLHEKIVKLEFDHEINICVILELRELGIMYTNLSSSGSTFWSALRPFNNDCFILKNN